MIHWLHSGSNTLQMCYLKCYLNLIVGNLIFPSDFLSVNHSWLLFCPSSTLSTYDQKWVSIIKFSTANINPPNPGWRVLMCSVFSTHPRVMGNLTCVLNTERLGSAWVCSWKDSLIFHKFASVSLFFFPSSCFNSNIYTTPWWSIDPLG